MPQRKGYITRQAKRLSDGEINRRRFVMSALSAGVTMPTALSLASKAEAHAPKPGGTLRLALAEGSTADGLDPALAGNAFTRLLAFARGNALTEIAPDGQVIGELAASFTATDNTSHWQFELRPDIRFHSGAPMVANDVIATLSRDAAFLPRIREMRADGPHRVNLTLVAPDPELPRRLADPRLVIQSAKDGVFTGTGPYVIEHFSPGKLARLARNPNYWKAGRAHVETVHLHCIPDVTARQQAIMTGDVDYADGIDPRALALLRHMPDVEVIETTTGRRITLEATHKFGMAAMNTISGAVSPEEILQQLLLGHGTAANVSQPAARMRSHNPLRLGLVENGVPRVSDIARLIRDRLAATGVEVELVTATDQAPIDALLRWDREKSANATAITLAWANDLAAFRRTLTHEENVASNAENDGARLIERWWFD